MLNHTSNEASNGSVNGSNGSLNGSMNLAAMKGKRKVLIIGAGGFLFTAYISSQKGF